MRCVALCFGVFWLLVGCQPATTNKPVESLTFEEKQAIVDGCTRNGKITTDDYCKQVAYVYSVENQRRKEQARINKALNAKPQTGASETR